MVCEDRYRDYIIDVFKRHMNSSLKLLQFGAWQGKAYATAFDGATQYKGVRVLPLSELDEKENILVAGINTGYLSQIMRALHDFGIETYSAIRWFSIHKRADFLNDAGINKHHIIVLSTGEGHACLGEVQVHATDSCNLNCKACTHFSPFVRGRRPLKLAQFGKDMERLKELFSGLYVFQIMGGEPLLEPEICMEMVKIVRHYYPDCSIDLITNGMLVDKMDDMFWTFMKDNFVTVRVSVYPAVLGKVERIKQILNGHGIEFICEISNKVQFEKYFTTKRRTDAYENMKRCHGRGCYTLYKGHLIKCPSAMYVRDTATELEKVGIAGDWLYANDAIDIYKDNNAWDIIRKLEQPCELCERCDQLNKVNIPWETIHGKPNLADWFIDY